MALFLSVAPLDTSGCCALLHPVQPVCSALLNKRDSDNLACNAQLTQLLQCFANATFDAPNVNFAADARENATQDACSVMQGSALICLVSPGATPASSTRNCRRLLAVGGEGGFLRDAFAC